MGKVCKYHRVVHVNNSPNFKVLMVLMIPFWRCIPMLATSNCHIRTCPATLFTMFKSNFATAPSGTQIKAVKACPDLPLLWDQETVWRATSPFRDRCPTSSLNLPQAMSALGFKLPEGFPRHRIFCAHYPHCWSLRRSNLHGFTPWNL